MSLARDIPIMRRAPLLRTLADDQLRLLAFASRRREVRRGDVLHEAGTAAAGATLVLFGQVELRSASDRPSRLVAGVGALLDAPAMLIETTHLYSAVARVETEVLLVPREQMMRMLAEFPEIATRLQAEMAARTAALIDDLAPVAAHFHAESAPAGPG